MLLCKSVNKCIKTTWDRDKKSISYWPVQVNKEKRGKIVKYAVEFHTGWILAQTIVVGIMTRGDMVEVWV